MTNDSYSASCLGKVSTNASNARPASSVAPPRWLLMNTARGNGPTYADPLVLLANSHQSPSKSPKSNSMGALLPAHSRSNTQPSAKILRTGEFTPTGTPSFHALTS